MEGNVYLCRWELRNGAYRLWLDSEPSVESTAETYEQAFELVQDLIGAKFGDGEATLEVVEPPQSASAIAVTLLVSVAGQDGAHGPFAQSGLFENGYCEYCNFPLGPRTSQPCKFDLLPGAADGAQNWCRGGNQIFSDRFISLLSDEELSRLEFLETNPPGKGRRRFRELVGKSVANFVAVKGLRPSSSKCEACGNANVYYLPPSGSEYLSYLALRDLPQPVPSCFAVGGNHGLQLCTTRSRWAQLVGQRGTSKIRSSIIPVLDESKVDRSPDMDIFSREKSLRLLRKARRSGLRSTIAP